MVISQPAVVALEQARERVERTVAAIWARARLGRGAAESGAATAPDDEPPVFEALAAGDAPRSSTEVVIADMSPLSAAERRARAAAVRGLMLARKRCYGTAQTAFAEAATLDPGLDLASVPTFWELHRAGQETVVRAYEDAGRVRDAAVLAATLRHTFRPRAMAPRRGSESVSS